MDEPVAFGDRYRDPITGYEGIATARTEYAHDQPSVRLTRASQKDGAPEDYWFSEARIQPVADERDVGFSRG